MTSKSGCMVLVGIDVMATTIQLLLKDVMDVADAAWCDINAEVNQYFMSSDSADALVQPPGVKEEVGKPVTQSQMTLNIYGDKICIGLRA